MTARILDYNHWQAARERRACRERAVLRALYAGPKQPMRPTLDEIMSRPFDPWGAA